MTKGQKKYFNEKDTVSPSGAAVVEPSDATVLDTTRGLYIGAAGNLAVEMIDGDLVTFVSMSVGFAPLQVKRVLATGTTATSILALY